MPGKVRAYGGGNGSLQRRRGLLEVRQWRMGFIFGLAAFPQPVFLPLSCFTLDPFLRAHSLAAILFHPSIRSRVLALPVQLAHPL